MRKNVLLVICVLYIYASYGQSKKIISTSNISPGFNYHLQITQLDIAPIITIKNAKRIQPGLGLNYLYYYRNSRRDRSSIGFNVFTRYFYTPQLFIHGEYLYSNVPYQDKSINEYSRTMKTDLFLGGGYRQPLTSKIDSYLYLLVNINHKPSSAYSNLILFKAGISF